MADKTGYGGGDALRAARLFEGNLPVSQASIYPLPDFGSESGSHAFLSRLRERRISLAGKASLGNPVRARVAATAPTLLLSRKREREYRHQRGFTLIELAIVLVVIGLLTGGILYGRDLIGAAAARAEITQVEKFNAAANTFYGKYGGLPGDLNATAAAQFGFVARAGTVGRGDGNSELDGFLGGTGYAWNQNGENFLFWEDLSSAHLIDGNFTAYVDGTSPGCASSTLCNAYMPLAKIGGGNFVYTYSGNASGCCATNTGFGPNFFGISVVISMNGNSNVGSLYQGSSAVGLTVAQAYAMDKKIDDGMPTSGRVVAQMLSSYSGAPSMSTNASTDSATTCYNSSTNAYSLTQNNGAGVNCALSFRMQAGD